MSRLFVPALVLGLLCAGCRRGDLYGGAFQTPMAAAVLQPEVGGPFEEPVGFVANGHGGQIIPLALKQGRFLTDDPTVSFLRTNPLATGGDRQLTSVAVVASGQAVHAFAGDARFGTLVRVPYLLDCTAQADRPECAAQRFGEPVEQGAFWEVLERPTAGARIVGVAVKKGYTTTETWTITNEGERWKVEGSRSGREPDGATTGARYSSELHRIGFTIADPDGTASVGDRFVVRTENGLSEHDVGGTPLGLGVAPDQSLIAAIVHDRSSERPFVRWIDPVTGAVVGEVALPPEALPNRLAWSEDGMLLITDRGMPAVWEVAVGEVVPIEHPMPFPTLDVASLDSPLQRRLYVVPHDGRSLWLFDRDTDLAIDVNAALEGDQGLPFIASITGIEAFRRPHLTPAFTDDAIRIETRTVAVALSNNRVVFADEVTGCLVQDNLGPRTNPVQGGFGGPSDYETNYLSTAQAPPVLELSGASGRHVAINGCGGIAKSEVWTVRYDQIASIWNVEGSLSGPQAEVAREDVRYLSDGGEVSFVIRSGALPARDGWFLRFTVDGGFVEADGDNDGDGAAEIALGVTADPVYFEYRVGLSGAIGDYEGAGWLIDDIRPFILLPGASSDQVGRVDPQRGAIELEWQ